MIFYRENAMNKIIFSCEDERKYGYVLPFEAVSILLLACIVGGLLIARKR